MKLVQTVLFYPVTISKSTIDGKGVFINKPVARRMKIGNMGGELIACRMAEKLAKCSRRLALVELGNGKVLNGMINGNPLRYINHSCRPNTFMRIVREKVEFYALKELSAGEELTCNYGRTHHDGKLRCKCNAKDCRKFI